MNYYSKRLFLAKVDKNDKILGKIERWEGHKKGILHRGFTVILFYDGKIVLQHRKHPAFDKFYDLTFSSHQIYLHHDRLQDSLDAVYEALKREWQVEKEGLKNEPKFLGKIYYKARDTKSIYTEHEIDYIYCAKLKKLPNPNPDFAYGFKLIKKFKIKNLKFKINFAPWVEKIIEEVSII